MFSRINSAVCKGIEGADVSVETDIARGLPGIYIVGLASTMVMESRERIRSAIVNSGIDYPRGRITVNLTPASLRKNGSGLDLPIAVGVLTSSRYIDPASAAEYGIIGELSLRGGVLGIEGVLPMIIRMKKSGIHKVIIPYDNAAEASLVSGIEIIPVRTLAGCVELINTGTNTTDFSDGLIRRVGLDYAAGTEKDAAVNRRFNSINGDFADIAGQENAKRALVIAVTGRHGLLMVGSPGCGKTMLASRIPSIMPPMTEEELLDTAVIYSAAGKTRNGDIPSERPFRNPHSTIGRAGLVGGGAIPVPGEITLAHNGVLFLDEVCEFDAGTIEALRTPIEEKQIVLFRKGENYVFPSDFQLVMAANPCPCGFYGDSTRMCKCTEAQLMRYRKKLSGPMMDRIDIRITMEKVEYEELRSQGSSLSSDDMKREVEAGIRFAHENGRPGFNAGLSDSEIDCFCALGTKEEQFMKSAYDALRMSPRSYKKTLKVARTVADLAGSPGIQEEHLAEALSYRITETVNG